MGGRGLELVDQHMAGVRIRFEFHDRRHCRNEKPVMTPRVLGRFWYRRPTPLSKGVNRIWFFSRQRHSFKENVNSIFLDLLWRDFLTAPGGDRSMVLPLRSTGVTLRRGPTTFHK